MHAQRKILLMVPSAFTSVKELYSLNKCTLPLAALHTDMNLEMRFRTLAVITIKGICALFQQKKNDSGKQSEKTTPLNLHLLNPKLHPLNLHLRPLNLHLLTSNCTLSTSTSTPLTSNYTLNLHLHPKLHPLNLHLYPLNLKRHPLNLHLQPINLKLHHLNLHLLNPKLHPLNLYLRPSTSNCTPSTFTSSTSTP